jgi:hypothetical protein
MKERNIEVSIYDLEGSVADLLRKFEDIPLEAEVTVKTLLERGFGDTTETEVLLITWYE